MIPETLSYTSIHKYTQIHRQQADDYRSRAGTPEIPKPVYLTYTRAAIAHSAIAQHTKDLGFDRLDNICVLAAAAFIFGTGPNGVRRRDFRPKSWLRDHGRGIKPYEVLQLGRRLAERNGMVIPEIIQISTFDQPDELIEQLTSENAVGAWIFQDTSDPRQSGSEQNHGGHVIAVETSYDKLLRHQGLLSTFDTNKIPPLAVQDVHDVLLGSEPYFRQCQGIIGVIFAVD